MSSRKNTLLSYKTVVAGDMSGNITSPVTNIQFLDNVGIQFNFSGSPVGYFQVQVSIDYAQDMLGNITNAGNWTPLFFTQLSSSNIPTSSGSPIYLDLSELSAPWIRSVYTATSGSGTLNSFITAKEI